MREESWEANRHLTRDRRSEKNTQFLGEAVKKIMQEVERRFTLNYLYNILYTYTGIAVKLLRARCYTKFFIYLLLLLYHVLILIYFSFKLRKSFVELYAWVFGGWAWLRIIFLIQGFFRVLEIFLRNREINKSLIYYFFNKWILKI